MDNGVVGVKMRFIGAKVLKFSRGMIGLKYTSGSSRHGLERVWRDEGKIITYVLS